MQEMIIDKVNGQPVPRYLIYDIIKFNVSSLSFWEWPVTAENVRGQGQTRRAQGKHAINAVLYLQPFLHFLLGSAEHFLVVFFFISSL